MHLHQLVKVMNKYKSYKLMLISLMSAFLFSQGSINAQSFGFGCLGLSGAYGGYTYQTYQADGLNSSIELLNTSLNIKSGNSKFEAGKGFRIGANLMRAKFDHFFMTLKGFYQFLEEKKDFQTMVNNDLNENQYDLQLNHWGVGLDFGVPVSRYFELKILEGGVTFYNAEFSTQQFVAKQKISDDKFESDNSFIGYYVASGLIINLIPDYISIEGTATYNFLKIDKLSNSSGVELPIASVNKDFIARGGFAGTVQLNLGFPF